MEVLQSSVQVSHVCSELMARAGVYCGVCGALAIANVRVINVGTDFIFSENYVAARAFLEGGSCFSPSSPFATIETRACACASSLPKYANSTTHHCLIHPLK